MISGRYRSRAVTTLLGLILLLAGLTMSVIAPRVQAQTENETVYIVDISGTIDLGLAPYLSRVLDEASDANAAAVILEINTPGGRLDAALQMRSALLGADIRTIAFVNREAFSAGALIAIAAEDVYMVPGGVMGAATPITGAGETADEKTVSAVRSTFRATAEQRGRDPQVAEAMVDPVVAIDGLIEEGRLLTLTTTEAEEWGYTDGVVANRQALLEELGLEDAIIEETSPGLAEDVVRFLTSPVLASLLFSAGFLLILADVFTGGIGALAGVGAVMLGVFFWGHFLAGLAGWEGVALVIVGVLLIGVEVFVIPGFGIPGILGAASLLGGFYLSVQGREIVTEDDVNRALGTVAAGFVLIVAGALAILFLLPKATRFRGLVLDAQVNVPTTIPERRNRGIRRLFSAPEQPLPANPPSRPPISEQPSSGSARVRNLAREDERPSLVGLRGAALSDLRPGGVATIQGQRIDVVTEGDYIAAGEPIEVTLDERYRRVVRRVASSD
ncbi:MAG: nodulation protein NfeD [Chloroflexia bacterium]|nr:nodulation protein NfeD [Chloroflexia bacterium]